MVIIKRELKYLFQAKCSISEFVSLLDFHSHKPSIHLNPGQCKHLVKTLNHDTMIRFITCLDCTLPLTKKPGCLVFWSNDGKLHENKDSEYDQKTKKLVKCSQDAFRIFSEGKVTSQQVTSGKPGNTKPCQIRLVYVSIMENP